MDQLFGAASHDDVLSLLVLVAILLFTARALGELASRLGQPSVVGELLAGILLGPSLLSGLAPSVASVLLPQNPTQGHLLELVSLIGAMFLLLITGLEMDMALIRRHARTAVGVSLGGILVTFSTGFVLGQMLPDRLLAADGDRTVFSLFVATAMAISSIPVVAKVLLDLGLMRRDIGQTTIAAGMSDDTIGWIILSVVTGMAGGVGVTAGHVLTSAGSVLLFMGVSFTIGRWAVKRLLDFVRDEARSPDKALTLVVILTFAWAAVSHALHIEAVLGAFVVGIVVGQLPRLPSDIHEKLNAIALGVFAPIFFAVAGLKVNLRSLAQPDLLAISAIVIGVATVGKVLGTYLGARLVGGRDHWTALCFGAGLNARGAMGVIIATIGLSLGILSQDMFSIIVLMSTVTSLMAPFALRFALRRVVPEEQELQRLEQEERSAGSPIAKIQRVLLPIRPRAKHGAAQTIETHLLARFGRDRPLAVTLMSVAAPGGRQAADRFLEGVGKMFHGHEVARKVVESTTPVDAILDEAQRDYDLAILGAPEPATASQDLFNPLIDSLVRLAPCATMIVRGVLTDKHWPPRQIIVPTNGSLAAQRAAEVAFRLAAQADEHVLILNVAVRTPSSHRIDASGASEARHVAIASELVDSLGELGRARGSNVETEVRVGRDPETVILEVARERSADLIVLGSDLRPGSNHLFLGPRVERLLRSATCPVIIVNAT